MSNWFNINSWEPRLDGEMTMAEINGTGEIKTLVTIEPQVYNVVKREDRFLLVYVGTAPIGTICDPTQSVNGKYVVPVSAVTWAGTVKPVVVVGTC